MRDEVLVDDENTEDQKRFFTISNSIENLGQKRPSTSSILDKSVDKSFLLKQEKILQTLKEVENSSEYKLSENLPPIVNNNA